MMTSTDKAPKPLRDVLYDFSLAKEAPDAELLEKFTKLYPCYADELTEFAIEVFVEARQGPEETVQPFDEASVSPTVSRAMSAFQVALQESRGQEEVAVTESVDEESTVENPFADLDRTQFRALAESVNANTVFLFKLRDCLINPDTMTEGFLRLLGDKLKVSMERLDAFFRAGGPQLAGQHFKAETKPSVGQQQSFEYAVRSSGLTEEQQEYLLNL